MQYILSFKQLFSLVLYIIGSWFVVHALALFGFFLSAAYPILWLFFQNSVLCFFCRISYTQKKSHCSVCRQPIDPKQLYPKTFASVIINAAFLAVLTVFFIALVFAESKLLSTLLPNQPTAFFSIPLKGQYFVDDTIELVLELKDLRQPINIVQSDLSFDPNMLKVTDINTNTSFATLFVQKEINNTLGYARLAGGIPNPGFSGDSGVFATVSFTALQPGATEVVFLPSSLVLANNSQGTNLLKEFGSTSYLILPKTGETKVKNESAGQNAPNTIASNQQVQLELYDTFSVVLGSEDIASTQEGLQNLSETELQKKPETSFFQKALNSIHAVDLKIISFYRKIAEFLFRA